MVSTRSKSSSSIHTGEKREHESTEDKTAKKPKVEKKHAEKKEAKLDIGEDGQVGLKKEESAQEKGGGAGGTEASTSRTPAKGNESEKEQTSGGPKETPDARPRVSRMVRGSQLRLTVLKDNVQKVREVVPEPSLKEPQHGGSPCYLSHRIPRPDAASGYRDARIWSCVLPVSTQDRCRRGRLYRRYFQVSLPLSRLPLPCPIHSVSPLQPRCLIPLPQIPHPPHPHLDALRQASFPQSHRCRKEETARSRCQEGRHLGYGRCRGIRQGWTQGRFRGI